MIKKELIQSLRSLFNADYNDSMPLLYNQEKIGYISKNKIHILEELKLKIFDININAVILKNESYNNISNEVGRLATHLYDLSSYRFGYRDRKPIYDSEFNVLGEIDRNIISFLGLPKFSIHVLGYTESGIWLSQRSNQKVKDPLYFDCLATGGVEIGNTYLECISMELFEECNIIHNPKENDYISILTTCFIRNEDFIDSRIIIYPLNMNEYKPINNNNEVNKFTLVPYPEILEFFSKNRIRQNSILIILYYLYITKKNKLSNPMLLDLFKKNFNKPNSVYIPR